MGKKIDPPKEDLAPAYFVQYSSLWCIMLGFFVMLLSFGKTQKGPGADGVGEIRDAFSNNGGLGILPFARNVLFGKPDGGASSFRIRKSSPKKLTEVDGYIRGRLWQRGLSNLSMMTVVSDDNQLKVVLQVPVTFRGPENMSAESVSLLELLSEVLLDLKSYDFEVMSVEEEEPDAFENQRHAMLKSAVVARFLTDLADLSPSHVRAVGYSDTLCLKSYGMKPVKGTVLLSIEKHRE